MPKDRRGGRIFNPKYKTVDMVDGVKVITLKAGGSMALPFVAGSSRMYILENSKGERKKIAIYDSSGYLAKEIHFDKGHTNRPKSGKKEYLKRGVAHVHNVKGGWGNNVRYLTSREIKKYGNLIAKLGGKVSV